jgi:sRNA-binding protein
MHHHRDERDELVRHLAITFPKAFFESAEQRLPLKRNILEDLTRNCTTAPSTLEQAVGWYQSDFAYQRKILSGAERIDLDGKPVAKITVAEQEAARRTMDMRKKQLADRRAAAAAPRSPPMNGHASTGAPMSKTTVPPAFQIHPAFQPLKEALTVAEEITVGNQYGDAMRRVLVAAALREVIGHADKLLDTLARGAPAE